MSVTPGTLERRGCFGQLWFAAPTLRCDHVCTSSAVLFFSVRRLVGVMVVLLWLVSFCFWCVKVVVVVVVAV